MRFIPWVGKIPGLGNGNSLQYSCLEIPIDRGAWQVIVHEAAKNWTQLSNKACTYILEYKIKSLKIKAILLLLLTLIKPHFFLISITFLNSQVNECHFKSTNLKAPCFFLKTTHGKS